MVKYIISLLLFLSSSAIPVLGQNEIEKELSSLTGINRFYAVVNIEGGKNIIQSPEVDVKQIQQAVRKQLIDAGLDVITNEESASRQQYPYLHIHINAMENSTGYIPFSVQANFYQPVELVLNRGKTMMASTWESGSVAIVSPDRVDFFKTSALATVEEFIDDYNRVN